MPGKLGFLEGIGMSAMAAGVVGVVGGLVVGGIAAGITAATGGAALPAFLAAGAWGAGIGGVAGTLLSGFACGMADDNSFGSILLGGLGATAAMVWGCNALQPPEAPKTALHENIHISARFNSKSAPAPKVAALAVFARKNPAPAWAGA